MHLAGSRKTVINEAAVSVRLLVEISRGWQAEVSEIVSEFRNVFLAQHFRFLLTGPPIHAVEFTALARMFAISF